MSSVWHPIRTAPNDKVIVCMYDNYVISRSYRDIEDWYRWYRTGDQDRTYKWILSNVTPSLWIPCPPVKVNLMWKAKLIRPRIR